MYFPIIQDASFRSGTCTKSRLSDVPGAHAETTAGYLVRSSCAGGWVLVWETGGDVSLEPIQGQYIYIYMMYKWHMYI